MRSIEFRAWDGSTMTPCGVVNGRAVESDGETIWEWHEQPKAIMQFTGLFDKNRTEIFEGDIVQNSVEITKKKHKGSAIEIVFTGKYRTMVAEVRWNEHWGQWDILPEGEHVRCYLEVIGNIYESPELLENK